MESEKIETSLRMAYRDNRLTEEQVARLQKIEFPFISRKEIVLGVNDLATLFPHLVEEWDKEKNGPLDLDKVHIGSPQRVWWLCPKCGLSYRKAIRQRTGRGGSGSVGCPICEGRVSRGVPAVTKYPILLDYFDSEKNKDIDLYELTASSDCLIKWKCPVCGYEWENSVAHFVLNLRRASKKGVKYQCPACSLHVLVPEINSLAARDPRLSSEWDIERNYPLMPNQVTYLSSKKCGGNAISATGHIERPCGICFVMREIVLIATTGRYWKAITIWRPCSQTSQHSGILTEMEIYCHRLYWLEAIKASGGNARRVVMSGAVG